MMIARYLKNFKHLPGSQGVILCPNFAETSKKSRFVVVLSGDSVFYKYLTILGSRDHFFNFE